MGINMKKRLLITVLCVVPITLLTPLQSIASNNQAFMEEAKEVDVNDKKEMRISFKVNDEVVKELQVSTKDVITEECLPEEPTKEGQDFLGWYWGLKRNPRKYEGVFPLDLSKIPENVFNSLNGTVEFVAYFGKNVDGNELEKPGYRLIFNEEFNGKTLDKTKWVDKYLSSWSQTWERTQGFYMEDGVMNLQIEEDTQPWCPEFDGNTVISGFTTGQRNGLHKWNPENQVRNPQDTELTHINQYGYYEMRAKGQSGSARHSAWWLTGFEDIPEESAEIDIFEVLGKDNGAVPPAVHKWNDSDCFIKTPIHAYRSGNKDFNNEYHVYGFDWQQGTGRGKYPDKIVFYVDGEKYAEKNVNIPYPMIQLISVYEKREKNAWTGAWEWMPYPNSMEVDYVRVYKKLPQNEEKMPGSDLKIEEIQAEDLVIPENKIELKTYKGTNYIEKNLEGTKSYVRVKWNDGVETQEPVTWDSITEEDLSALRSGKAITKEGLVKITSIPGTQNFEKTTMQIKPEGYISDAYKAEGIHGDLELLFDKKIDENDADSAEFTGDLEAMKQGKWIISYDFEELMDISGIDMWTNYGKDQGIKKCKVATWDEEANDWNIIKENDSEKEFVLDWKTQQDEPMEKQSISFDTVRTSKVQIIITDVGYTWNKFAMREIDYQAKSVK